MNLLLTALRFVRFVLAIIGHITTKMRWYAVGLIEYILTATDLTRLTLRWR